MAHMRYLIFAEIAEKEGFTNVARLFRAIAHAELVHARSHYNNLKEYSEAFGATAGTPAGPGNTSKNLELAAMGARGEREVEELTGVRVPDPPQTTMGEPLTAEEWSYLSTQVAKTVEATRSFRSYLPQVKLGRGYPAAPLGAGLVPLEELSEKFKVSQAAIDFSRASRQPLDVTEGLQAAARLALREDEKIRNTLLGTPGTLSHKISSWDEPGAAVREVGEAVSKLVAEKHVGPYVLFVSPARYVKLLAVHEKTGVMELTRLKALVRDVVPTPVMPDDVAVLVSSTPRVLDVVIGADTEVEYLGPEDGVHVFRVWETIALRVYDPRGVVVLKQG
jgi:uncharacterized linocin/CFP29 family protein